MSDDKKEHKQEELYRAILAITDELRRVVDNWDMRAQWEL